MQGEESIKVDIEGVLVSIPTTIEKLSKNKLWLWGGNDILAANATRTNPNNSNNGYPSAIFVNEKYRVIGIITTDQKGMFFLQGSFDGFTWNNIKDTVVFVQGSSANPQESTPFNFIVNTPFIRPFYTNGAVAQSNLLFVGYSVPI